MIEASLTCVMSATNSDQFRDLFSSCYDDLLRIARSRLRFNEQNSLLDTTSLVHETFLRLEGNSQIDTAERVRFLAYAAQTMRSIIVDCVRERNSSRRGGGEWDASLDRIAEPIQSIGEDILRLHEALDELESTDERLVRVVEMRFFGGLTEECIADTLGINKRTVRRDWQRARTLLSAALR
jgi:RNA polymerase sigma factor (TIGR02999 family)